MKTLSRRSFIKVSGGAGVGLLVSFPLTGTASAAGSSLAPSGWIKIDRDGVVTLTIDRSEMGQGVLTSMRMILADELEADWSAIVVGTIPDNPASWSRGMMTAGSGSIRHSWKVLRTAGAAAREMLVSAAAARWDVEPSECRALNGEVIHEATKRRLSYGALADAAAALPVPEKPLLKDPREFRLIGKPVRRLDTPAKVNGSAVFAIDVDLPGLLVATVLRSPVLGGKVRRFNAEGAFAIPGVRHVLELPALPAFEEGMDRRTPTESAVAVVADSYWQAVKGRRALDVEWDEGPNAGLSSAGISEQFRALAKKEGIRTRDEGDASAASPSKKLEAFYETPYLHHATMEPMNCTAHVQGDRCEIWVGTQAQSGAQEAVARLLDIPRENVRVHTTLLGGGFGRRVETDFISEAVLLSKSAGVPIKVIWSREDDVQHGFYRPATYHRFVGGLDDRGEAMLWDHRIVAPSLLKFTSGRSDPWERGSGIDSTSVEGARNLPYSIPHLRVELINADIPVPLGWWRSVGSSQNAFVTECFVDEMAEVAGEDPFEYRRKLLSDSPRHRRVLEIAASKADWGAPLPPGRGRGIAVAEAFGSYVAEVAEVSVEKGRVRVHRVVCAVDCGQVVNPDTVEAQMEGGIVFGITAALYGSITLENGRVLQSNFHDYPLLRMDEMPKVEVHIVPNGDAHGGVGEPGVPPAAPAVCNAVFSLTGKRIRKLPIVLEA